MPQASRADEDAEFAKETRRTWARLLAKIFEVDPMLCSCGAGMKIVSVITRARVVDRILRHLESERLDYGEAKRRLVKQMPKTFAHRCGLGWSLKENRAKNRPQGGSRLPPAGTFP